MYLVLGTVILLLFSFLIMYLYQVGQIINQLNTIRSEEKTNKLIQIEMNGFGMNKLADEVNKLILSDRNRELEIREEKQKIKQQISSISHDFRTPLTSIIGYIDFIKDEEDEEKRKEYVDIIYKKSIQLKRHIDEFYEMSLIEDENYEIQMELVHPGTILEDVLLGLTTSIEEKGINLKIDINSDDEVFGNTNSLARVYTNLIQNIIRYGHSNCYILHGIKNGRLITVFNNDVKNPENIDQSRFFEKFYTADSSRTKTNSGLGLYTTKLIIEKMKHSIEMSISGNNVIVMITYKEREYD